MVSLTYMSYAANSMGVIAIATGEMLDGDLPNNALILIRQWLSVHRDELLAMWESQKLGKLPPLE